MGIRAVLVLVLAAVGLVHAVGCAGDAPSVEVAADGLDTPIDAAASADGSTLFAITKTTVFSISGGAATALHDGFVDLRAIAVDDDSSRLFLSDGGSVVSVRFDGSPAQLGPVPLDAEALDLVDSTLYVAGADSGGTPGVFAVDVTAMTPAPMVLASGAPLVRPTGIAGAGGDEAFVTDASGHLLHIAAGTATPLGGPFLAGTPAGTARSLDGTTVLSSALSLDGTSAVVFTDLDSGTQTTFTDVIGENRSSGGLHRARDVDAFAWADLDSSVYKVKMPGAR